MTLLEVSIKGVLESSGAVKDYFSDVHSAFVQNFLQFVVSQPVFGLISDNFGCLLVKSRHTAPYIFYKAQCVLHWITPRYFDLYITGLAVWLPEKKVGEPKAPI